MNLKKIAFTGLKWVTLDTIGRVLFQMLQIAILTRFLPKETFGLMAMALFVIQFSNIFLEMGLTSAILNRQDATRNQYSSIFWLNIFISIILYGMLFLIAPIAAEFYEEPELNILIRVLGINLLFMAIGRQHQTIMQKHFQFKSIALIDIFSYFLGLIIAIILAFNNFGIYCLIYSTLVTSLISNSLFLITNIKLNPIRFHFSIRETKPFLKIGGYTVGSTILDFFSRETDILLIGKMLGAEGLGAYSLSKQIIVKIFSISNPIIINVLNPLLSSIQTHPEKLKKSFLELIKMLGYINFPIYLTIIVASKEILFYVYGQDYVDAYPVLSFLSFAYCIICISNPVGSLQIATGRTDLGFKWTIMRVIISPLFIYIGATQSITMVALFYSLLSVLLVIPIWLIQLKPMIQINLKEYLNQFYKPFIYFVLVTVIIYFTNKTYTQTMITITIFKTAIILLSYGIFMIYFDKKSIIYFSNLVLLTIKQK